MEMYARKLDIPYFRGVFMKDRLPRKIHQYETGVINLDNDSGPGTHWTAYKKYGTTISYFDSFGNLLPPIETQLYFQSNEPCTIFYNHNSYQSYDSIVCGHLCLNFLVSS